MTTILSHFECHGCTITLSSQTRGQLPLLKHGAKLYAVAVPGEEFSIEAKLNDLGMLAGSWAGSGRPQVGVQVHVDGQDIGYVKLLSKERLTAVINNFLGAPGAGRDQLTNLKFEQAPAADEGGPVVQNPDEMPNGKIKITLRRYVGTGTPAGPTRDTAPRSTAPAASLPEGKKFFMAPSLSVGQGASSGLITWSSTRSVPGAFLGSITIHYETAGTLALRKVLNPKQPSHAAILRDFDSEGAADEPEQPSPSQGRKRKAAGTAERPARQVQAPVFAKEEVVKDELVKEEPVKEEPSQQESIQEEQDEVLAAVLALSKQEACQLVVNGRVVQRNELAVCDLSADDAGIDGPHWDIQQKPVLSVFDA